MSPVAVGHRAHRLSTLRQIMLKNVGSWPKFVKWPRCTCGVTRCSYARRSQKRSLTCFRQTCHCFHGKWPRAHILQDYLALCGYALSPWQDSADSERIPITPSNPKESAPWKATVDNVNLSSQSSAGVGSSPATIPARRHPARQGRLSPEAETGNTRAMRQRSRAMLARQKYLRR